MALTQKNKEFLSVYCSNGYNGAAAWREVYGIDDLKVSWNSAWRVLKKPEAQEYIKQFQKEKLEQYGDIFDAVVAKTAEIAFAAKDDKDYKANNQLKALDMLLNIYNKTADDEEVIHVILEDETDN